MATVEGCAVASDQAYREADLAIDFCEDVPALPKASVEQIVSLFEKAGAVAKVARFTSTAGLETMTNLR